MGQQHWDDPAPSASPNATPQDRVDHVGRNVGGDWAATPWAVVTATGIVQTRCGQATSEGVCGAWRLSAPGGERWKPCYACGSVEIPAAVQAAGAEVAAAIAEARQAAGQPP
jgi:hypothetical protein